MICKDRNITIVIKFTRTGIIYYCSKLYMNVININLLYDKNIYYIYSILFYEYTGCILNLGDEQNTDNAYKID